LGTIPDPQRINVLAAFATLDLKKQHCWGENSVGFEKGTLSPQMQRWIWKSNTAAAKAMLDLKNEHCCRISCTPA